MFFEAIKNYQRGATEYQTVCDLRSVILCSLMRVESYKYFYFVKHWPGDNLTKLSIPSVDTAILSKNFYFI